MDRLEIASKILAGFAANNAVFAANSNCGWSLVNCTDEDLVGYSLSLADKLIEGEKITADRKANTTISNAGTKTE
jgi:hypothetical protein